MNEPQLIIALKNKEEEAFRRLVSTYETMVFNTCLGILQHDHDAEDVAQEVFIKVYQTIGSFKEESKLSTWIYRICITQSLDFVKYRQRKKRFGLITRITGGGNDMPTDMPGDFNHPGVQLANKEKSAVLFKAIKNLPENQKVAFVLQKIEGLSQSEIAGIMKQSEGSIESLLQRAKQNLRSSLATFYKD